MSLNFGNLKYCTYIFALQSSIFYFKFKQVLNQKFFFIELKKQCCSRIARFKYLYAL